ncbi:MAG: carboxypeptidase-like regulatory domain-containing protein [Saprospiraceae bacterium]
MKNILLIFLLIFLFSSFAKAQNIIKGTVLQVKSSQPIGYVNIGVLGKINGTVSDENGNFTLQIKSTDAMIKFSSIGFEAKVLTTEYLKSNKNIYLEPTSYSLKDIQIDARKFGEPVRIGKRIKKLNTVWGWPESDHLGMEIGIRIKIKKETLLKSVHFGIHKKSADSILFRINIYDFKDGKVGENLLTKNIFVYAHEIKSYATVNLSKLNLIIHHDVMLTLERIEETVSEEDGWMFFNIKENLKKTNIYYRNASQAEFHRGNEKEMGIVQWHLGFYFMAKEAGM